MNADTLQQTIELAKSMSADRSFDDFPPKVEGYTSHKIRLLLNLLGSFSTNYLEIGVHKGATFSAAIWNNLHLTATSIDNWSLEGSHQDEFESNIQRICIYDQFKRLNIIERDCFSVPLQDIPAGVDLYLYDGDHNRKPQYDAIAYYYPVLAKRFVYLVDDCNWEEPRDEARHALLDFNCEILFSVILPARAAGHDEDLWWNGFGVFLAEKTT
jgi:hypothetical protein